ncbi:hypothetical protein SAMN05444414_1654 [Roseovarius marisflavi]|uniref:Uncharacterized protein n=1 Tax=Roseovarius marisflavi TaxID=1054996 RepID=A0A1M7E1I0_9RHOB|nr:hypothetical protein SAMN05444414_1654 [Roseovarius marisflavi]
MLELICSRKIVRLMLLHLLLLCAAPPLASAGSDAAAPLSRPAGLMWNRTGLPAVFPLQVKTPPGQDYFLTLIDQSTDKAALAAYIKGGAFFKVLVPPGVFRLRFASGDVWQGEDDLFGPGVKTDVFELRKPLAFETRGLGVKAGHVVNLLERRPGRIAQTTLKDQLICQSFRLGIPTPIYPVSQEGRSKGMFHQGRIAARPGQTAGFDRDFVAKPGNPADRFPSFTRPGYDVRSRYCG